jgi:GT2 family glycosyltransferase
MTCAELPPKVFVVILNWNGWKDTLECLESNYASTYPRFEAVVVDNGSTDASLQEVRAWAREKHLAQRPEVNLAGTMSDAYPVSPFAPRALTLIETGRNLGFSRANNRGIEYALANGAEFIFLLNNDTIVQPDALEHLVATLKSDEKIGAAYALVLGVKGEIQLPVYLRPPRNLWEVLLASNVPGFFWSRYRYRAYLARRNPYRDYRYDRPLKVPNIVAACTLYRREFFERLGLFDENVFLYREEDIMLQRLKGTELTVALEPRAKIIHKIGQGTGQLSPAFLYLIQVRGEMYYVRTYLRSRKPWQIFLKLLRLLQYLLGMAKSADYRKRFPEFLSFYVRNREQGIENRECAISRIELANRQ